MSGKVRSKIIKSFQIRGFTLRSEASKFLLEALTPLDEDRQDLWLKRLLDLLQVQRIDGPFLTKDDILGCIREFERSDSDGTDVRLLVADAFALAPLTYWYMHDFSVILFALALKGEYYTDDER
ncbi:hypothetical protein HPB51_021516 [Rhipicephalus microplus]|uniref:DNA polymerase epsilon subunit B N-terminal domain-containing protein n=1 Tax=Rhipicephalus microplus TaxID=6941 RepID=A0A9J6DJL4_RHIMP|nr:hypothetical protein HPB51_021516 [Rhipicephalus microplus]